ncbi:hypothetical protein BON30_18440 [Cystobacter ferrugineus]|uniref:Uncharacterized protein n=1 Tax=Cystobacter ferrugineus TaxID=83449 RepID=A0A1L9BB36_9BACT|nr:hypothetical protein BON30_18440 [Cystobacter ferrugineus]
MAAIRRLREEGLPPLKALQEAARVRPTTEIVASLGFLPMAFATGAGAELPCRAREGSAARAGVCRVVYDARRMASLEGLSKP